MIDDVFKRIKQVIEEADRESIHSNTQRDLKLSVDIELSLLIKEELGNVISEEDFDFYKDGLSSFRIEDNFTGWIVDPLDGSYNFFRGLKHYYTSLAYFDKGDLVEGYLLNLDNYEIFSESTVNRITLEKRDLSTMAIGTGFPLGLVGHGDFKFRSRLNYEAFKKIRSLGSACAMIAEVLRGSLDIYCEEQIFIWDVAGGAAIAKKKGFFVYMDFPDNGLLGTCIISRYQIDLNDLFL